MYEIFEKLKEYLKAIDLPKIKVMLTGGGRVSQGAQYVLNEIGAQYLPINDFLAEDVVDRISFTYADADNLVRPKDEKTVFSFPHFFKHLSATFAFCVNVVFPSRIMFQIHGKIHRTTCPVDES